MIGRSCVIGALRRPYNDVSVYVDTSVQAHQASSMRARDQLAGWSVGCHFWYRTSPTVPISRRGEGFILKIGQNTTNYSYIVDNNVRIIGRVLINF